ncbi:MAG: tail fiber domain-containing protein [Bacteroidota bacterium]
MKRKIVVIGAITWLISINCLIAQNPHVSVATTSVGYIPKVNALNQSGNDELNNSVIYQDGSNNIGINTTSILAKFHVYNGSVLFSGTSGNLPTTGAGTRFMWVPSSYALRAGRVTGTQWDNLGLYSVAFGNDNTATGTYSTAFGNSNTASGQGAFACGVSNTASGTYTFTTGWLNTASADYSVALGYNNTNTGNRSLTLGSGNSTAALNSFAMGELNTISVNATGSIASGRLNVANGYYSVATGLESQTDGYYSFAACRGTIAQAYASMTIGQFNIAAGTSTSWVSTDPVFIIGNGTSAVNRSNAITFYKNGDGTFSGQLTILGGSPGAGKVLTSDANGLASWTIPTLNTIAWRLLGNSGTTAGTNFMGTIDDVDVVFKRNNVQAGRLNTTNTSWGVGALNPSTTGSSNIAIGLYALQNNTTGNYNSANGAAALQYNTEGSYNVANGVQALYSNTEGISNTAAGYFSLYSNTTGDGNTAVGHSALYDNTGDLNTAIGYGASDNTTGSYNTANGGYALNYNTTGTYNTAIGYQSNVYTPGSPDITNLSNATAIGYGTLANATNKTVVSNGSCTWNGTLSNSDWSMVSDSRIKNNIKEDVPGLSFIVQLRPVTYNIDLDKENSILGIKDTANWRGKYDVEKIQYSGFIAQEVEAAAEKIGYEFSGLSKPKNEHDIYSLGYASFVVPLVKSVQELNTMNEQQQSVIDSLKTQLAEIKTLLSGSMTTGNNSGSGVQNNYNVVELSTENAIILNQNDPNPFAEETDITYYLPDNVNNAKIMFYDNTGKIIKSVELEGKGNGTLHVYCSSLSTGIYTYALIADGKTIDSMKMVKSGQ